MNNLTNFRNALRGNFGYDLSNAGPNNGTDGSGLINISHATNADNATNASDLSSNGATFSFVTDSWVTGSNIIAPAFVGDGSQLTNIAIPSVLPDTGDGGSQFGNGANGSNYGAAMGQSATGSTYGAAMGNYADGSNNGAAVGVGANGSSNGAAMGYYATGSNYGAAVGYGANGSTDGAAMGKSADGSNYGAAMGVNANGSNYGAAVGYSANGHGLGNVAIGGDDTGSLNSVVPDGFTDTIELGRGTAALNGGLNFRGIAIVDYHSGSPQLLGDASRCTGITDQTARNAASAAQTSANSKIGAATTDTLTNKSIDAGQLTGTVLAARLPATAALTTNTLAQFASTTSAQLRGVISDSTGTGAAVFATAPTLGVVTVRHLIGSGTPTIAAGTGLGTSPTVAISGNDVAGKISVTSGTLPTGAAVVVTVTFATAYGAAPHVILSPHNATSAALSGVSMVYAAGETTTTFTITAGAAGLAAATSYEWSYLVIQ